MGQGVTYTKIKGDPEPHCNCKKCNYYKKCRIVLAVALAVVSLCLIAVIVLAGEQSEEQEEGIRQPSAAVWVLADQNEIELFLLLFTSSSDGQATSAGPSQGPPFVPCCLEGWVGYRGKCYYFSKEEKNWDSSQHVCSSFNASLAVIDTQQEKDFMMRYAGLIEHWIGLRRESDQPWKWVNGTIFSQQLFEIRAGGDCAYLSEVFVSSSRCRSLRNWICSKPDAYTKGKEHAVERD